MQGQNLPLATAGRGRMPSSIVNLPSGRRAVKEPIASLAPLAGRPPNDNQKRFAGLFTDGATPLGNRAFRSRVSTGRGCSPAPDRSSSGGRPGCSPAPIAPKLRDALRSFRGSPNREPRRVLGREPGTQTEEGQESLVVVELREEDFCYRETIATR